jgi:hypothetical protein
MTSYSHELAQIESPYTADEGKLKDTATFCPRDIFPLLSTPFKDIKSTAVELDTGRMVTHRAPVESNHYPATERASRASVRGLVGRK